MSLFNTAHAATTTTAGTSAHAPSMAPMLVILAVIILFYFWMWRQQSRKSKTHRDLLGNLSKGDEVVTNGGIAGKVSQVDDQFITLRVAKETDIMVQKPAIATVLPKGSIKHLG